MIKVEDLRVGSALQIEDQIITVGKIDEDFISWKYNIKDRSFWNPYISLKDERLKPIELTEEILLKCGFEKDESWGMLFIKRPYLVYHDKYLKTNILGVFISGSSREYQTVSKPFNHLHQLQNLYFALTNEELKINL